MSLVFDRFFGRAIDHQPPLYFLTAGCSHTSAVGVDNHENWTQRLSHIVGMPGVNMAEPGGNAWVVSARIGRWFLSSNKPKFVVVQWPHPMRTTVWKSTMGELYNVHNLEDKLFQLKLEYGEWNFWAEWMQSIITTNAICIGHGVPIVNFSVDPVDEHFVQLLESNKITLYDDPMMWMRDKNGSDQRHNGPLCHQQWATQLSKLINEITSR